MGSRPIECRQAPDTAKVEALEAGIEEGSPRMIVCASVVLVALLGGGQAQPAPSLVCRSPVRQFGTVTRGVRLEHTFLLENHGKAPLTLKDIKASCECTTAPLTQKTLAPGMALALPVTLDTRNLVGGVDKSLAIQSDDPARPVLILELKALVRNAVEANPAALTWSPTSRNAPLSCLATLRRPDGAMPLVRSAALADTRAFEVEIIRRPEAQAVDLQIHLIPGLPTQFVQGALRVVLEDPIQPQVEIPIAGQLLEDLVCTPGSIDLGRVGAGTRPKGRALVALYHPQVELQAIEVSPPWCTATVKPRRTLETAPQTAVRGFELSLQVSPSAPKGPFLGEIQVRSSSRDLPVIRLPLKGEVVDQE